MSRLFSIAAIATLVLVIGQPADAQFLGDHFFSDPTPMVAEGDEVTLTIQVFTGPQAFGASQLDVEFDDTALEVLEVRGLGDRTVVSLSRPGSLGIATLNGAALDVPIGTIALVELRVRPLVPAGQSVTLSLNAAALLRPTGESFASTGGLVGTIFVVPAGSPISPLAASAVGVGTEEVELDPIPAYRDTWVRAGGQYLVPIRDAMRGWLRVVQRTYDPLAPSDSVPEEGASDPEPQIIQAQEDAG